MPTARSNRSSTAYVAAETLGRPDPRHRGRFAGYLRATRGAAPAPPRRRSTARADPAEPARQRDDRGTGTISRARRRVPGGSRSSTSTTSRRSTTLLPSPPLFPLSLPLCFSSPSHESPPHPSRAKLYSPEDREAGGITAIDRFGLARFFLLRASAGWSTSEGPPGLPREQLFAHLSASKSAAKRRSRGTGRPAWWRRSASSGCGSARQLSRTAPGDRRSHLRVGIAAMLPSRDAKQMSLDLGLEQFAGLQLGRIAAREQHPHRREHGLQRAVGFAAAGLSCCTSVPSSIVWPLQRDRGDVHGQAAALHQPASTSPPRLPHFARQCPPARRPAHRPSPACRTRSFTGSPAWRDRCRLRGAPLIVSCPEHEQPLPPAASVVGHHPGGQRQHSYDVHALSSSRSGLLTGIARQLLPIEGK